jgi:hypothetical protein
VSGSRQLPVPPLRLAGGKISVLVTAIYAEWTIHDPARPGGANQRDMEYKMKKLIVLSALALGLCNFASGAQAATILRIEGAGTCTFSGNHCFMNQSYGDTATVDVTYEWISSNGALLGAAHNSGTNFGDLGNVLVAGNFRDGTLGQLTLKARDGYELRLIDFDFAGYFNFAPSLPLKVMDLQGNELIAGVFSTGTGSSHSSLVANTDFRRGIVIRWGPDSSVGGIDNIRYDTRSLTTAVPEPASWALMISGLGLVGGIARRRIAGGRPQFACAHRGAATRCKGSGTA